jgi:CBS domain-containing protein
MAPWWRRLLGRQEPAIEYVRAHALRAKDIMTPDVISVAENTPLARIASILVERRIGRLPVLREGRLVGIVTRADLVAALGRRDGQVHAARPVSDESIRTQLLAELQQQRWWRPDWSVVLVTDGVVRYGGLVESEGERRAARVAAENVPGVRAVVDQRGRFSDWQTML